MTEGEPRRAEQRRGWWPGWIWSVPIAALGIVGWLAIDSWTQTGPEVKVVFPTVADLRPGDTTVTFESYAVGHVSAVQLSPDLHELHATLQLNADMRGHLGKSTQFWIIGRSVSLSHLSNIKSLISGVSIGIKPAPGKQQDSYRALGHQPALGFGATGTAFVLHADRLGSVQDGTPIYYLGQEVGSVTGHNLKSGHGFDIAVFVDAPFDKLVHDKSRFWRAGPVHLSTGGNGPSLEFQSLPALFEGAIAFETPGGSPEGAVATKGHSFVLHDSADAARNAPDAESVAYRATFHTASGVPSVDAPVMLMGKRVGSVTASALRYDEADGKLAVVTTFALEPRDIPLAGNAAWTSPRTQMDDMLRHLIAAGLRAQLSQSPPVIGGQQISLVMAPGQPGRLGDGDIPAVPTTAGGGVSGIIAQANAVVAKVDAMPLRQIGDNLKDISDHLDRLTRSPALEATLRQVDRSTANIQHLTEQMRHEVPPALTALRRTIGEAQASLASAKDLLSARGDAANSPGNAALPQTLYEITRTARALRQLSDLLERDPSALLTGRPASK